MSAREIEQYSAFPFDSEHDQERRARVRDEWRTRIRTCNADDLVMWNDWDTLSNIDMVTLIQELSREGMQLAAKACFLGQELEERIRIETAVAAQQAQRKANRQKRDPPQRRRSATTSPPPQRRRIATHTGDAPTASSSATAVNARPPLHHANLLTAITASVTPPAESQTMAAPYLELCY